MTINSPMDVNLWSWEGQCDPVCWLLAQVEARSVSGSGLSPGQLDRVCRESLAKALDGETDTPFLG